MKARKSAAAAPSSGAAEIGAPTLPAWKAFVVQLSQDSVSGGRIFAGRVEHLHSGRRARFASRQDLLAIIERLLHAAEDRST